MSLFGVVPEEVEKLPLPAPEGHLSVENIIAVPPGAKEPVLRGISFALQPGEVLGVLGPSAAGKSSLARVLVGVWSMAHGKVRIDGAEINHWAPERLGRHIGYLPQDVELFSGSIAENIARFNELDEVEIITAARMAGVHDMVQALPAGYNTQIGEGGFALSGGQRQRLGLARALYGKPAYIILDEPNASLDADGEAALLSAIQQLRQEGCTVVLITHKTNILRRSIRSWFCHTARSRALAARDEILSKLLGPRLALGPGGSRIRISSGNLCNGRNYKGRRTEVCEVKKNGRR